MIVKKPLFFCVFFWINVFHFYFKFNIYKQTLLIFKHGEVHILTKQELFIFKHEDELHFEKNISTIYVYRWFWAYLHLLNGIVAKYKKKEQHYSQVAFSWKTVTMTEMKCCKLLKYYILYYNCVRRSGGWVHDVSLSHVRGQ